MGAIGCCGCCNGRRQAAASIRKHRFQQPALYAPANLHARLVIGCVLRCRDGSSRRPSLAARNRTPGDRHGCLPALPRLSSFFPWRRSSLPGVSRFVVRLAALDEAALIKRVQDGDRSAFEALVEAHQGAVYGYFRARVLQPQDAEDLTQDLFLRCYLAMDQFDTSCQLRPWLMGFARNLLREYIREHKRRKEVGWTELCLQVDEMLGDDEGPYEDELQHLPNCLNSLGTSARQAIGLRYTAKMRLAQIGEKLRRSEGAVKLLMFRARQALKQCLSLKCGRGSDDG